MTREEAAPKAPGKNQRKFAALEEHNEMAEAFTEKAIKNVNDSSMPLGGDLWR